MAGLKDAAEVSMDTRQAKYIFVSYFHEPGCAEAWQLIKKTSILPIKQGVGTLTSSRGAKPDSAPPWVRFVGRQPILTSDEQVFGYELLFRDGVANSFTAPDGEAAARSTLDSSILLGLDVLCEDHYAFLNCTRDVLLHNYPVLLPAARTVVEVLETVPPDSYVAAACHNLRKRGYLIALDDFVANDPRSSLTGLADIIKVDLKGTSHDERRRLVEQYGKHCRMLAEKVETREEFRAMRQLGFIYFQGYFFQRPEVLQTRDIANNSLNYLRMLQAVSGTELDLRQIESLIKGEASICYRLLRYLNSALFSFGQEIHSVRHALSILGDREIRRWVRLVATIAAGQQKSTELVFSALVRGRFCELLSPRVPHGSADLFLMGLMSLMDAILEAPMEAVLEKLPLEADIKTVLLGRPSPLRLIFRLMLAQESGEWPAVAELARLTHLDAEEIDNSYWRAMQWARQVSGRT
jgi:c-di-GMP-related signal transduction protein